MLKTVFMTDAHLPIEQIRDDFEAAYAKGPVALSAPTGSGKSTQIPRWCRSKGALLVIEPRRVACRGLASRVAQLEGCDLGEEVGYCVRNDNRSSTATRILFATPGVVLQWMAARQMPDFGTVILDEFHERSLSTDLLLALLLDRFGGHLVVMSATLDAERIARHLEGAHIRGHGRAFAVDALHIAGDALLPDVRGLDERVENAVRRRASSEGDILVFLPGKAEIARLKGRLEGYRGLDVLEVHGGLKLAEQSRIFEPSRHRKIILATNVAETSITIPGVRTVIDSGLVRRTRYFGGRGYLTLVPIAWDSAQQRAGRAGRTAPGVCYRLWSPEAVLEPSTPPEIHREALSELVLAAAACDARVATLPFLDPPKDYAVSSATADLTALGALDAAGKITSRGRRIFGLPLDANLGGLLVEAERHGCQEEAVDLVSALAVGRPLFERPVRPEDRDDDPRSSKCDAIAHIRALREGQPERHGISSFVLSEARSIRKRLREAFAIKGRGSNKAIDRSALVRAALTSDPHGAYVARRRRGRVYWGNGGPEITLGHQSAIEENETDAVYVLSSMALGQGMRDKNIIATCAMPVRFTELAAAGLGEETVEHSTASAGCVTAQITRTYAGQVIDTREEVPSGNLARRAVADLLLRGRLHKEAIDETKKRLEAARMFQVMREAGLADTWLAPGPWEEVAEIPTLETWVQTRLEELGLESGEDIALLSRDDFLAPDLPEATRREVDRLFPRQLALGDATYRCEYDTARREVMLVKISGNRKGPPALATLPAFRGFCVKARHHSRQWTLRDRT